MHKWTTVLLFRCTYATVITVVRRQIITWADDDRLSLQPLWTHHVDVINWKHCPRHWPFVSGIHRSPVNSPHKGQWWEALFTLRYVWTNSWANHRDAGDLNHHCAHHDITAKHDSEIEVKNEMLLKTCHWKYCFQRVNHFIQVLICHCIEERR